MHLQRTKYCIFKRNDHLTSFCLNFLQKNLVDVRTANAETLTKTYKYFKLLQNVPNYLTHLNDLRAIVNKTEDMKTDVAKLEVSVIYLFIYIRAMRCRISTFPKSITRHRIAPHATGVY